MNLKNGYHVSIAVVLFTLLAGLCWDTGQRGSSVAAAAVAMLALLWLLLGYLDGAFKNRDAQQGVPLEAIAAQRELVVSRLPIWKRALGWYDEWDVFVEARRWKDTRNSLSTLGGSRYLVGTTADSENAEQKGVKK